MINAQPFPVSSDEDSDTPRRGTILIVDDKPSNLEILFQYLDQEGFKVRVANSGQNALAQVGLAKPDLIMLDVVMPGLDGFETCRRLKADEINRDIPVIFMTALADTSHKQKGFDVGAVDYVTKPLQHYEIVARVTVHLAVRQLQQRLRIIDGQLETERAKQRQMAARLRQLEDEPGPLSNTLIDELHYHLKSAKDLTDQLLSEADQIALDRLKKTLDKIALRNRRAASIIEELRP